MTIALIILLSLYKMLSILLRNKWSSHQRCSVRKGVLRNFVNFTGKHLWQSLFFNKIAGPRPATLLKKRLWHRCVPVNFAKFLRTPFLTEHLWVIASKTVHFQSNYFLFIIFLISLCYAKDFSEKITLGWDVAF